MHYQRVKIIEAKTTRQLEKEINTFIEGMTWAPVQIAYGTANAYYEDEPHPYTRHIAYITYRED